MKPSKIKRLHSRIAFTLFLLGIGGFVLVAAIKTITSYDPPELWFPLALIIVALELAALIEGLRSWKTILGRLASIGAGCLLLLILLNMVVYVSLEADQTEQVQLLNDGTPKH